MAKSTALQKTQAFPSQDRVIATTFDMIAEKGLGKTRLSELAKRLNVSLAELYRQYPTINAIIAAFMDHIDQEMIRNASPTTEKRDLYFDLMMGRLDKMQEHRPGMVRWLQDMSKQPALWPDVLKRWDQSLSLMLDIAQDSPVFPVKKLGLAAIYATTLQTWVKDDNQDMSKTMAKLDQNLGRVHDFAQKYLTKKKRNT